MSDLTALPTIDEVKRLMLRLVLKRTHGNRAHAAKILGISIRSMRDWIRRYDLAREFPPDNISMERRLKDAEEQRKLQEKR